MSTVSQTALGKAGHLLMDRREGKAYRPPASSPERSVWRQQVQRALRKAPGWQADSLSWLGALALRRADSHWLRSFRFCRGGEMEGEEVSRNGGPGGAQGHPAALSGRAHLALEVGGVQRPRAVPRHHLHHVGQLEGALVHALHRADVRHRDGGTGLGERRQASGQTGLARPRTAPHERWSRQSEGHGPPFRVTRVHAQDVPTLKGTGGWVCAGADPSPKPAVAVGSWSHAPYSRGVTPDPQCSWSKTGSPR